MLDKGNSEHWEDILKKMTGSCEIDASYMLRYYKPLHDWLIEENERLGNKIGW